MKKLVRTIPTGLVLAACASTAPMLVGDDTFLLVDTGVLTGSSAEAVQAELQRQADGFCRQRGQRAILAPADHDRGNLPQLAHVELQFRCLDGADPGSPPTQPPDPRGDAAPR